jgi:hypothetical protein
LQITKAKGFIRVQTRSDKDNPAEYATYCPSCHGYSSKDKRTEKDIWLGKILDKEKGVYYNRNRGVFGFTVESGFYSLMESEMAMHNQYIDIKSKYKNEQLEKSSLSIDFGDIYILNKFFQTNGLFKLFKSTTDNNIDTLLSLILYRILTNKAFYFAEGWWKETVAQYLYPNAHMSSEQISKFLFKLGDDIYFRKYIIEHINYVNGLTPKYCILIDSTGLPNDIRIPITAVSNHNGTISNEIRLIFVVESNTGFPIYYKHVAGNIVDVSTLSTLTAELKEYGIKVNRAILDAEYYSEKNLLLLYKNNIPFITRMTATVLDYKQLIEKYEPGLKTKPNHLKYNGRHLYIKRVPISLFNNQIKAYAYVCKDVVKEHEDENRYNEKKIETVDDVQFQKDKQKFGTFVLLSTANLKAIDILPCYYARQGIELIFDYLKNEVDILPIRVHSETAFKGHLLICFMALTGYISFKNELDQNDIQVHSALDTLSRYHCEVFSNRLVPNVASKKVNDICKALQIQIPREIKIKK